MWSIGRHLTQPVTGSLDTSCMFLQHLSMFGRRLALLVGLSACTTPNPRSCADGICNDPQFPFCDVEGTLGGSPNECIAVDCTPNEVVACRGNDELSCNSTGNNFEVTRCEGVCDPTAGCAATRIDYVVFVSNRDGNSEIYRMAPDGSLQTNLTLSDANDDSPQWDPTGERIAFHSNRNGTIELFVMQPDGSDAHDVSQGDAADFAWSPDGSKLVFSSERSGASELYVVDTDGSNLKPLTQLGSASGPAWSPDGSQIAFVSNDIVQVMDADGSNPLPISGGVDRLPVWSPDGSQIAFSHRITFTNNDVFVVSPDGTNPHNITNTTSSSEAGDLSWSPDGMHLSVTGGTDVDFEVFSVDLDGVITNLSNSSSSIDRAACWSPDSESVIFGSNRSGNSELLLVSRLGGATANLTMSSATDEDCSWRPR